MSKTRSVDTRFRCVFDHFQHISECLHGYSNIFCACYTHSIKYTLEHALKKVGSAPEKIRNTVSEFVRQTHFRLFLASLGPFRMDTHSGGAMVLCTTKALTYKYIRILQAILSWTALHDTFKTQASTWSIQEYGRVI